MKSNDPVGLGRGRHQGRLDEALKVDGQIETMLAKFPPGAQDATERSFKRDHLIDERISFEQRHPTGPNDPTDVAVRKAVLEARDRG